MIEKNGLNNSLNIENRKINVLHILDMVGGSSIQSHFYNKFGYGKSIVFYHKKAKNNPVVEFYNEAIPFPTVRSLVLEAIRRCRSNEIDIIHLHQAEILLPIFKLLTNKKIVLQYQGSDINEPGRSKNIFRIIFRSMADTIIYNQKFHLKKIITIRKLPKEYHVNAVDTDHFKPQDKTKKGTVAFISDNMNKKATLKLLEKFEGIEIINVAKADIPHKEIPNILNNFEMMVDLKVATYNLLVPTLSMLSLQSLACGCKVYTFQDEIKEGLPERHKPEVVIKKLYDLFYRVLTT